MEWCQLPATATATATLSSEPLSWTSESVCVRVRQAGLQANGAGARKHLDMHGSRKTNGGSQSDFLGATDSARAGTVAGWAERGRERCRQAEQEGGKAREVTQSGVRHVAMGQVWGQPSADEGDLMATRVSAEG